MSFCKDVRPYIFDTLVGLPTHTPGPEPTEAPEAPPAAPALDHDAVLAAAWAEGERQGYEEGLRRATEAQQAAVARLVALAAQARVAADQYVLALEQQVVQLSLAIAEKVIEREVQADPGLVANVVRAALAEVREATVVAVLVHPTDHALLAPHWEAIVQQGLTGVGTLRETPHLVADEQVQSGGCIIHTRVGQVDAQLATKLAELANSFRTLGEGGTV
jgi:flagellar assembly protein FliH